MKILIVSDLHYSLKKFDWVLSKAAAFDLVILAGDLLDVSSSVDFGAQIIVTEKYLQRFCQMTRVILCSGNHDLDTRSTEGEKVARWIQELGQIGVISDGMSELINDIFFTVCAWWDGPILRESIQAQLERDLREKNSYRWIWIHHAPPEASQTSWTGKKHIGDKQLNEWINNYRPEIVISGHVHQSPFVNQGSWVDYFDGTWSFNAGHQYGEDPAFIALNLETNEAFWLSGMGAQSVRLNEPLTRPIPFLTELPSWI